ncbi:MAG: histidinol dehydrogenase [Hyphomicrobiales bacterium]|jgi:histidinol dehydrogenase|nr:histidinol dehydrogenase [Hyphomicrobiales bacterium]|tara:strand:- start:842 stop:2146 length:1305 start_codon:yes stop_codon:yes gene_type:complete
MSKIFNIKDLQSMKRFYELQRERSDSFSGVSKDVIEIISKIKDKGDDALIEYTNRFDQNNLILQDLRVDNSIIRNSIKNISEDLLEALLFSYERIHDYHKELKPSDKSYVDKIKTKIDLKWSPIDSVGIYVPGGKAIYPSSVLMNVIPAIVAGVKRIVMVTPSINGALNESILAAADICKVDEIYRIGGAQAIAALAYGTSLIKKVDMIVGPGNSYVAAAKKHVFGDVGIDMVAGPSEVVVVADADIDPDWVIEDLFAQAEHDNNAQSILITRDIEFASIIERKINDRLSKMKELNTLKNSWERYGSIILCDNIEEISNLINDIAPEHLQLCISNANELLKSIKNAGAIFIGKYTPEAIGDYVAGSNHVLPTLQTAKFSSGLSVLNFMKRTSIIECNKDNFNQIAPSAITIAEEEGLISHARSLRVRLDSKISK